MRRKILRENIQTNFIFKIILLTLGNLIKTKDMFKTYKQFKNGGKALIHELIDKKKPDYKNILSIACEFAKQGKIAKLTPILHHKSEEYKDIYRILSGTKYDWKCPDLKIDNLFYEYESFTPPFSGKKLRRMLSHGAKQSSRIIINNNKGASDTYIRRYIHIRLVQKQNLNEVWVYERGTIRLMFKKQHPDKIRVCNGADP